MRLGELEILGWSLSSELAEMTKRGSRIEGLLIEWNGKVWLHQGMTLWHHAPHVGTLEIILWPTF